jgi:hypothetical protein
VKCQCPNCLHIYWVTSDAQSRGAKRRWAKVTKEQRSLHAKKAAAARWGKAESKPT